MPLFDALCPEHGPVEVLSDVRADGYPCEEEHGTCGNVAVDLGITGLFAIKMGAGGARQYIAATGQYMTEQELETYLQSANARLLSDNERKDARVRAAERVEKIAKARGYSSYGALKDALAKPNSAGLRDSVAAARERTADNYASKYGSAERVAPDSPYWRDTLPASDKVTESLSVK